MPRKKRSRGDRDRDGRKRAMRAGHDDRDEGDEDRSGREEPGIACERDSGQRERERAQEPGDAVRVVPLPRSRSRGAHPRARRACHGAEWDHDADARDRRRCQSLQPHGVERCQHADLVATVGDLGLGAHGPPDDDPEVDQRDLEDDQHEDRFPGGDAHRWPPV